MLKPGMCSVTLNQLSPEEVIEVATEAKLSTIEWGGSKHVPHGDIATANKVKELTRSAGLEISSYGSYYRTAVSELKGLTFQSVLDSAEALGAPTIRVWAGEKDYDEAGPSQRQKVIDDTNRIADMAGEKSISITFEYHGGTLTDRNNTAILFSEQVPHSNVFSHGNVHMGIL